MVGGEVGRAPEHYACTLRCHIIRPDHFKFASYGPVMSRVQSRVRSRDQSPGCVPTLLSPTCLCCLSYKCTLWLSNSCPGSNTSDEHWVFFFNVESNPHNISLQNICHTQNSFRLSFQLGKCNTYIAALNIAKALVVKYQITAHRPWHEAIQCFSFYYLQKCLTG